MNTSLAIIHVRAQAIRIGCLLLITTSLFVAACDQAIAGERNDRVVNRLTGRKENVRLRALAEIQESTQSKYRSLELLIQAAAIINADADLETPLPLSHVSLIRLIGTIDRVESENALTQMLSCKHPEVVTLASDTLGKNKFQGSIPALAKLKDSPLFEDRYGFRFNLIRSLFQMEHPDAVELITCWLPSLDGQLKHQVEQQFEQVDLETFKGNEDRFAKWKKSHHQTTDTTDTTEDKRTKGFKDQENDGGPLKLKPASFRSSSTQRLKLVNESQFYGMDIYAKRMMFIIDHSGSMREFEHSMTRLGRAKVELIRAIEGLDPDAQFAIMFYASGVEMWRDELTVATDEKKLNAIRFIKRLGYGNRTNTHGALLRSLSFDSQLEAVYLLSDGRPTEGRLTHPDRIIDDITQRNRFRHLHFNTVGISVTGKTERFLESLAIESGGEFRIAQ